MVVVVHEQYIVDGLQQWEVGIWYLITLRSRYGFPLTQYISNIPYQVLVSGKTH